MASKKKSNRVDDDLAAVNDLVSKSVVSAKELVSYSQIEHPIFSFKYLSDFSYSKCRDASFFRDFLSRLQKLSDLGWKKIALSHRHSFGTEKIDVSQIKPKGKLPPFVTDDMKLEVFRAAGNNLPFVGLRDGRTFHIFLIETSFGEVYDHD